MRSRVWLAILLAAIGWGSGGVANRAALLEGADAYTVIGLRLGIAVVLVLAYLWAFDNGPTRRPEIWWRGGLLGVIGMGLPMIMFTLALNHISAGLSGMIIALIAIVTVVWAHFILDGESMDPMVTGGMLIGLAGAVMLVVAGDSGIAGGGHLIRGGAFTLGGVLLTGLSSALSRKYMLRYPVLAFGGPQYVLGTVVGLLAWLVLGDFELADLSAKAWLLIAYLGVIGTTLPFLAFLWASQLATATRVAVVGYLVPIIALVGGIVFLDERLTWLMGIGGALIVAGVVIVDRIEATRSPDAPAPENTGSTG